MNNKPIPRDQLKDILMKEYDLMRAEVRMYIQKLYLALTAILAIITAGVFKADPIDGGFVYIWIPFVVAGIIAFMSVVTFYINKTAGYIKLVEQRINLIYGTVLPVFNNSEPMESRPRLALLLWESFYADIALERDNARQLRSSFAFPLIVLMTVGIISISLVLSFGILECLKISELAAYIYFCLAAFVLYLSARGYIHINTTIRNITTNINRNIMAQYTLLESIDPELEKLIANND